MSEDNEAATPGPRPSTVDPEAATKAFLRRRQIYAAIGLALAALAFWAASRMVWARVVAADGLGTPRTFSAHGSDWSPWLTPLALVLLAAILAAFSLRGWGLRLVAILIAIAGVVAAVPAISLLSSGANADYASRAANMPGRFDILLVTTNTWAAVVVLAGAVCAVTAGVFLVRVAGGGTRMSSKYTTPAARRDELERQIFADHEKRKAAEAAASSDSAPEEDRGNAGAPANERMMWDALDTGIDPTQDRSQPTGGEPDDKR